MRAAIFRINTILAVILVLFSFRTDLISQDMTIQETVNYINQKLQSCPYEYYNSDDKRYTSISVKPNGEIIFHEKTLGYRFYKNYVGNTYYSVFAKDIDLYYSFNECSNYKNTIQLKCSGDTRNNNKKTSYNFSQSTMSTKDYLCFFRKSEYEEKKQSYYNLGWSKDCQIGESICNALIHLISKIKSNPNYKERRNPNDPFDKSVDVKSYHPSAQYEATRARNNTSVKTQQTYRNNNQSNTTKPSPTTDERKWNELKNSKSIYSLEQFVKNYPYSSYVNEAKQRIVDLEVDNIMKGDYGSIPSMQKTGYSVSDVATISLKNSTSYTLTIRYSGNTSKKVVLNPSQSTKITLSTGAYRIAASVSSGSVRNYAGTEYLLGGDYSSEYYISRY